MLVTFPILRHLLRSILRLSLSRHSRPTELTPLPVLPSLSVECAELLFGASKQCPACMYALHSRSAPIPELTLSVLPLSGDTVLSEPDGSLSFCPRNAFSFFELTSPSLLSNMFRCRDLHSQPKQRLPDECPLWTRAFHRDGDLYEVRFPFVSRLLAFVPSAPLFELTSIFIPRS